MRLIGSFLLALLVALALFGLMLALVTPPERAQMPERELVRIGVTRSVADSRNEHQPQQAVPERPTPPSVHHCSRLPLRRRHCQPLN